MEVYVPYTCQDDFTTEISLIPNTHVDFNPIFSRSYYDTKYDEYKSTIQRHNINAISTFALVDSEKDKTHTGKWKVKVERRFQGGEYGYIVLTIDKDGRIQTDENGKPVLEMWKSNPGERSTILCVCESDFTRDAPSTMPREEEDGRVEPQQPQMGRIDMVQSTTSSHYSVFRQRIPDYDLKEVRHYLQFKTRLEGMELMLEILGRNINLKEIHASECFAKETMAISRLFDEFKKHEKLMELVVKYYEYVYEYDELYQKLVKLRGVSNEKEDLLNRLLQEYNDLSNVDLNPEFRLRPDKNLDAKIALGEKIKTLKLEIDKSLKNAIDYLVDRLQQIVVSVDNLNQQIEDIQKIEYVDMDSDDVETALQEMREIFSSDEDSQFSEAKREMKEKADQMMQQDYIPRENMVAKDDSQVDYNQRMLDIIAEHIRSWRGSQSVFMQPENETLEKYKDIASIDTTRLHEMVLSTERWRNYMQNMGYELNQMKQMFTMCEDATIKVRRLVHNFKERMQRTERDVWDGNHQLRPDFDFAGISTSGLYDIILLHDWYACNAPRKTPQEMGMTEDEFDEFCRKCNTVSYNLRKNQYAQLIEVKRERTQQRILELQDIIADEGVLHWKDKYGWEAKKAEESDGKGGKWNAKDYLLKGGKPKASVFAKAERALRQMEKEDAVYKQDVAMMKSRTMEYLGSMGIARNEDELESLAVRNAAVNYKGDIMEELDMVERRKTELDSAMDKMNRQRSALKSIIDGISQAELEIVELKEANKRIFDACIVEKNRQRRNRLLLQKLDNEGRIADIQSTINEIKDKNLKDFTTLERMRADVDKRQTEYDDAVAEFKRNIGVNEDMIENLAIGIYNKYQGEILENTTIKRGKTNEQSICTGECGFTRNRH